MFIFSPNCRKNAKDCKERVDNPHHAEAEAVKKALVSSLVTKTQLSEKEVPPIADCMKCQNSIIFGSQYCTGSSSV